MHVPALQFGQGPCDVLVARPVSSGLIFCVVMMAAVMTSPNPN